MAALKAKQRRQ